MALGRTVEELDASMTTDEFYQWVAFSSLEPWGEERADWRSAHTNALLSSLLGSGKKQVKITDYLLKFEQPKSKLKLDTKLSVDERNKLALLGLFPKATNTKKG
jgi:hypothetical protein